MINKVLQFYNYDKALAYFEDQLMHIHQAPVKRSGFKAVAKPVLLLTVLKAIDNGTISANRFDYNLLESHSSDSISYKPARSRLPLCTILGTS